MVEGNRTVSLLTESLNTYSAMSDQLTNSLLRYSGVRQFKDLKTTIAFCISGRFPPHDFVTAAVYLKALSYSFPTQHFSTQSEAAVRHRKYTTEFEEGQIIGFV